MFQKIPTLGMSWSKLLTCERRYLPQFEDGTLKVFVEKVFPWEQVVEAHQLMEKNATKGKIICTIS